MGRHLFQEMGINYRERLPLGRRGLGGGPIGPVYIQSITTFSIEEKPTRNMARLPVSPEDADMTAQASPSFIVHSTSRRMGRWLDGSPNGWIEEDFGICIMGLVERLRINAA